MLSPTGPEGTRVGMRVEPVPRALLLCGDATVACATLRGLVEDAGFEVVAAVRRWSEAVERAVDTPADVAVVDLALAGTIGVRLLAVLRTAAPSTTLVAVSPLPDIDLVALEAGARAVVHPDDLRPVGATLRALRSELRDTRIAG
jgi:DNA-binding response OmpR family regulator